MAGESLAGLATLVGRRPLGGRSHAARHPAPVALDAAVQLATILVLLEEGLECVEEHHAALVEHGLLDDLVRPPEHRWRDRQVERLCAARSN